MNKKNILLYGFGTVGKGFYHIYRDKANPNFELIGIIVKNLHKHNPVEVPIYEYNSEQEKSLFLQADIIIECTSNYHEGKDIVINALQQGKTVISASKKVLAEHLPEIIETKEKYKAKLFYESAAAAAIPIFKILHYHFSHENVKYFQAILNGTCNFILTKMELEGLPYSKTLHQAQLLGYAETDPYLDVSGWDTAYKLILLVYSASGIVLKPKDIFVEGIENLTFQDIYFAKNNGLKIKLLAQADIEKGIFFVCPAFVSNELANINEAYNGIRIEYEYAQSQFYTGRGAGKDATGSSVWADLNVSQNIANTPQKPINYSKKIEYHGHWFIRLKDASHTEVLYSKINNVLSYNKIQHYYIVYSSLSELQNLKQEIPNVQIIEISNEKILKLFTQQSASCSLQF